MSAIDSRTLGARIRLIAAAAILIVLALRLGARPFLDGLVHTDPRALAFALVVTAATTGCSARRWCLIASGLGVGMSFRSAYRSYYRSQFLNATLPGGVLGDVHRGYRHGQDAGAVGRGLLSVAIDRASGQVTQVALAVAAVPLLPTALRGWVLAVLGALMVAGLVLLSLSRARREVAAALTGAWAEVAVLSALAAGGHVLVFLVAARTAGVTASAPHLLALALLVLVASAIPVSVAGWGPREGAAAWAFGAAGLGAAAGVEVAVVYGVMSLVATLPGMLILRAAPNNPVTSAPTANRWIQAKGEPTWTSGPTYS
ncbi:lysylphosphatidylglycerol synthase transmembrane domain-containing protein [Nocardioides sp. GXZ039]|uniref:lysylphosphatidylglycerol synthase transmembrane domain-containing protein n=1 Tax=Nocardioides sp. GXZ039 TaxID=3136018 RepID=UPI0030F4606D